MDSTKKLADQINQFYKLVESHEKQVEDCLKEAKKPCDSILNQSLIFRAVIPENSIQNTEFEQFDGFREDLIDVISCSLEEELVYLDDIRNKIEASNEILRKEQKSVENLYISLRDKNLIDSTKVNPCSPSFEHIITWCSDIWCYYHSFYLQISQAIVNLKFENEESVKVLIQSFKENSELKKHINKIKSYNLSHFEFVI